jgi:hypothetical protein
MFEQVDALPAAPRQPPVDQRDRELHLGQRRAEVSGHIIGTFVIMLVGRGIFGRYPGEIRFKVAPHLRRRIFLDQQRRGGMAAEQGR